jgi:hypothetical protein
MSDRSRTLSISQAQRLFKYNEDTGEMWRVGNDGSLRLLTCKDGHGYVCTEVSGIQYKAHRLAFLIKGVDLEERHVDHIDGNRANNEWKNLRLVSHGENMRNRSLYKNNKTGTSGIRKVVNRWEALIHVDSRQIRLGTFATKEEAVVARKQAETELGFHKNHGRNPT